MKTLQTLLIAFLITLSPLLLATQAHADLSAGVATVSITPIEEGIPTQLGGYGERNGKPAEGIHDTLYAKVLVLQDGDTKAAMITIDACSTSINVAQESLEKAAIEGLSMENTFVAASHSHAGLEGFSLDRRNIANNPKIGIFSEEILGFVTDRIAQGLKKANAALRPVTAATGTVDVPGANQNRRGDPFVDEGLTLLRLDDKKGHPYVLLVNYTAHGTIMTEKQMLTSGGWAGQMQRTVEALVGGGVTCMYTNGAEGDLRPRGAQGGSRWEMAENYGRHIGIYAARLAETMKPKVVTAFAVQSKRVQLPPRKGAPDFMATAGKEYGITPEDLSSLLQAMFPATAPIYALRVDDFAIATFPGEAICEIGLSVKDSLRSAGIAHPCVACCVSEHIGYILTKEEYAESGYEVAASFYGDGLGKFMLDEVTTLAKAAAK